MVRCHCCGSHYRSQHRLWGPGVFKCISCGHNYRASKKIDLAVYYNNVYRDLRGSHDLEIRDKYCKNLIGVLKPYLDDCDSLLEVGAGDGHFSKMLCKQVKNVSVCEIDLGFKEHLDTLLCKEVFYMDFLKVPDETKYDVVIGVDVLEHFYDPNQFKRKVVQLSKEKVIVQVPIERKLKLMKRGRVLPFDGHYHYFVQSSIAKLFEPEFEVEFCMETELDFTANKKEMIVVFKRIE